MQGMKRLMFKSLAKIRKNVADKNATLNGGLYEGEPPFEVAI